MADTGVLQIQTPRILMPLLKPARYKGLHGGRGGMKCLGIGTPVLMYDGSIKQVEDILVGDLVMGPDSKPRTVLGTSHGESELFEIKQSSAMTYVVNEEHILSLRKSLSCVNDTGGVMVSGNLRRSRGRYPEWPTITNIKIREYLAQSNRWKEHFRGYRAGLIEFPANKVPVDPYLLGVWLGDGLHRELMITSADHEIADWLTMFCAENGLSLTAGGKPDNAAKDYRLSKGVGSHGRLNPVWEGFKAIDVVSNKHIPQLYISNSEEVRFKLLAGLIDTDGHCCKNGYVIDQARYVMASGIKHLADSLGFRTSINRKETTCTNNGVRGEAWSVHINGDTWRIPCLVTRKQVDRNTYKPNKDKMLSQLEVKSIGSGEYAGFSLDSDHLFCLADGTVTHNSWFFAEAMIEAHVMDKTDSVCLREIQKSLQFSAHKLLSETISRLNAGGYFDVQDAVIKANNGGIIVFQGMQNHTADSIKSLEGFDRAWLEEAQNFSQRSLDLLRPTIRKPGSEIWASWNRFKEDDPIELLLCGEHVPDDAIVIEVNLDDNPWAPPELLAEREIDRGLHDADKFDWIWRGKYLKNTEGDYYKNELTKAREQGRICRIPNMDVPVNTFWDIGNSDGCAVWFHQCIGMEDRFIGYYEAHGETLAHYARELQSRGYIYNKHFFPHDADHKRLSDTNKSVKEMMEDLGLAGCEIVPVITDLNAGIQMVRSHFPSAYFDEIGCKVGLKRLGSYRKRFNATDQRWIDEPNKANGSSEAADAFRQWAQAKEAGSIILAGQTQQMIKPRPPPNWRA